MPVVSLIFADNWVHDAQRCDKIILAACRNLVAADSIRSIRLSGERNYLAVFIYRNNLVIVSCRMDRSGWNTALRSECTVFIHCRLNALYSLRIHPEWLSIADYRA